MNHPQEPVAVLFGGIGKEAAVSERSAAYVLSQMDKTRFLPHPIGIDRKGDWYFYTGDRRKIASGSWKNDSARLCPTFPVRQNGRSGFLIDRGIFEVVAVLPVMHGDGGEDGSIQGLLKTAGLPFVGSDVAACAVGTDKAITSAFAASLGIPTLPSVLLTSSDPACPDLTKARQTAAEFGFPLFLKPTSLGSSVGASPVLSPEKFDEAFLGCCAVGGGRVLMERFLRDKREIEVAWFSDGERTVLSAGEILCEGGFYGYKEKYAARSKAKISPTADLSETVRKKLYGYTEILAEKLGVRDLCRFDFFLDGEEDLYFNEVNLLPGMTKTSLYHQIMRECGIPLPELLSRLILAAASR